MQWKREKQRGVIQTSKKIREEVNGQKRKKGYGKKGAGDNNDRKRRKKDVKYEEKIQEQER